jgi:hypothetical protein
LSLVCAAGSLLPPAKSLELHPAASHAAAVTSTRAVDGTGRATVIRGNFTVLSRSLRNSTQDSMLSYRQTAEILESRRKMGFFCSGFGR